MRIIIEGAGEVGSHLAKMLRAESNEVTVIDSDAERLSRLSSYADVETVEGNPSSIDILKNAGAAKADLFIAVFPFAREEVNLMGALLAKQLGARKAIARINDEDYLTAENLLLFKELGIDLMFYPERNAADEIIAAIKHNTTADSMDFAHGKLQIAVYRIDDDSPCFDLTLQEFTSGLDAGSLQEFRIIAIARSNKTIFPKQDTKFLYGDLIYAFVTKEGLPMLSERFGKGKVEVERAMIMGGSAIGAMLARSLSRDLQSVKIIESDKDRCIELSEKLPDNVMVVNGDGRNPDFLAEESISEYDAFIALTSNDEANILSCVAARKMGVQKTVAEVENTEYIHLAEEMGVDTVINKKLITAGRIFKFTLSDKARFVKYMSGTDAEVIEYTVAPGSAITRGAIRDINFPQNALIGGVIRGGKAFIAVGDTRIEAYDRVAIFALPESMKEIDRFFKQ